MARRVRAVRWLLLGAVLALSGAAGGGDADAEDALTLPLPAALDDTLAAKSGRWLPAHQRPGGFWSARDWDQWCLRTPRTLRTVEPRPAGRATAAHDLCVTSLSLTAFLGAGYSHRGRHPLASVVSRGLRWLKRRQRADGCFARATDPDPESAHALATLAMTEAYGMSDSLVVRDPCRAALDYLLAQQAPNGAWKRPDAQTDDPLATLFAALALKCAALINKDHVRRGEVPPLTRRVGPALTRSAVWFDTRTDMKTGVVSPISDAERMRGASELVLTAAGALVRVLAGRHPQEDATVLAALAHLGKHLPSTTPGAPETDGLYAWIGTLAVFQGGGELYARWKKALAKAVIATQIRAGTACDLRGSWNPTGRWATARGRVAMTSLASLAQEVFYRYDKVFGSVAGAVSRPRLHVRPARGTWARSQRAVHAARITLPRGGSLPLDAVHVRADIRGARAQVVLDLFVTNTRDELQEGVLALRLPAGAAPYYLAFGEARLAKVTLAGPGTFQGSDLASLQGASQGPWGFVREARMGPVAEATEAFERVLPTKKDPALLTWSGADMFQLRVYPLLPGKQHRILVAYEVDLARVGDDAELRLGLPEGVEDRRVTVTAPGATWSATPAAALVNGVRTWSRPAAAEIVVRLDQPGDTCLVGPDAEGRAHTAAWLRADIPRVPRRSNPRAQFLVDVSQSAGAGSVHVWRRLVPAILDANRDTLKTFDVGFFDMRTRWWRDGAVANTPANVAALRQALASIEPGGATDLAQALASARARGGPADIHLFSDGVRTFGQAARPTLRAEADSDRPVFAYLSGIGSEDRSGLAAIADTSGGWLISVLGAADVPAAARAHRWMPWVVEGASAPGLTDVMLAGHPRHIYPGQRLRLVARGTPRPSAALSLSLSSGRVERTLQVALPTPSTSPMAARVYGYEGVRRLEAAGPGLRSAALDYATHFRVVRGSCALIMLETEAEYVGAGLAATGHGARVAARPVLPMLADSPSVELADEPEHADPQILDSVFKFTRFHDVPSELLPVLKGHRFEAALEPLPEDSTLRLLGSAFEQGDVAEDDRFRFALHAHALGLHRLAARLLGRGGTGGVSRVWILARAAARSGQTHLALAGYEIALGTYRWHEHSEVVWAVAADYDRYLRRLLAGKTPTDVRTFAQARCASLVRWRKLLGPYAPPTEAALAVLNFPYRSDDLALLEVRASQGVLVDSAGGTRTRSNLQSFPEQPDGTGPQLIMLATLPDGTFTVRRVRRPSGRAPPTRGRSFVVVIRDWGRPGERIEVARSIGPEDDILIR